MREKSTQLPHTGEKKAWGGKKKSVTRKKKKTMMKGTNAGKKKTEFRLEKKEGLTKTRNATLKEKELVGVKEGGGKKLDEKRRGGRTESVPEKGTFWGGRDRAKGVPCHFPKGGKRKGKKSRKENSLAHCRGGDLLFCKGGGG